MVCNILGFLLFSSLNLQAASFVKTSFSRHTTYPGCATHNPKAFVRAQSSNNMSQTTNGGEATSAVTTKNVVEGRYNSVVFSAYVVPTIPRLGGAVGDPDGAGFVSGTYVGVEDPMEDIADRVKLVAAAAEQAWEMAAATRDDPKVLHVFVVPEFFFRGSRGAYPSTPENKHGLRNHTAELLRKVADAPKFVHWLFVCGTILESDLASASEDVKKQAALRDDLIQAISRAYNDAPDDEAKDFIFGLMTKTTEFAQSRPLYRVKNQCYIYKQMSKEWPEGLSVDKRFVSHEDFVLSRYSPEAYSEASVAYPYVDESGGEIKQTAFDSRSIFELDGINFAVEICLDHRRARLRTVRGSDEDSRRPIDVHLVVSCGMQIQQPSVVARAGGLVFNCDGQYAKRDVKAKPDDQISVFTGSADGKGHTQLCIVTKDTGVGGGTADDADAVLEQPGNVGVVTAPLKAPPEVDVSKIEAYGAGEIHVYSKHALPSK